MWWDFLFWASPLPNSYFLLAFQNDTLFWLYQLSIQTHTVFIIKISPTCIYRVNNLEDVVHFCLYVSTVRGVVVVYHWSLTVLCIGHTMHKYEIRSVRNTVPPNLRRFRGEIQMQISMRKKSDFTPKQIHVTVSLNLRSWVSPLWLWGRF